MPMRSHPIVDDRGRVIGVACYREPRASCQTKHCRGAAVILCDYPVTRRGKATTCSRHVCRGCAKHVGPNLDYCPPHARLYEADAPRRADEAKLAEILAGFTPCAEPLCLVCEQTLRDHHTCEDG